LYVDSLYTIPFKKASITLRFVGYIDVWITKTYQKGITKNFTIIQGPVSQNYLKICHKIDLKIILRSDLLDRI
jgi:hypothetical protein